MALPACVKPDATLKLAAHTSLAFAPVLVKFGAPASVSVAVVAALTALDAGVASTTSPALEFLE